MASGTMITTRGVVSPNLRSNGIDLNGIRVDHVTANHKDRSPNKVPLSQALYDGLADLQRQINLISGDDDTDAVFTKNLVSPSFKTTAEDADLGWSISGGYTRPGLYLTLYHNPVIGFDPNNQIRVPTGRYEKAGRHFLHVNIPHVQGQIQVLLNGLVISTINQPGSHSVGFTITNPYTDELLIRCTAIPQGGSCEFASAYVVGVKPELTDYITHMIENALASDTISWVDRETLDRAIAAIEQRISDHESAANPHSQYVLRSELPDLNADDTIVSAPMATIAVDRDRTPLPQYIQHQQLTHLSMSAYDPVSGIIETTVNPITEGSLVNAISGHRPPSLRHAYFDNELDSPTLTYTYHLPTPITHITLHIHTPGAVKVTSATITVNDSDSEQSIIVATEDTGSAPYDIVVEIPDGFYKTITITDITTTEGAGDYGIGFSATHYEDANIGFKIRDLIVYQAHGERYTTPVIPVSTATLLNDHTYALALEGENMTPVLHSIAPAYNTAGDPYAYPLRVDITSTRFGSETWESNGSSIMPGSMVAAANITRTFLGFEDIGRVAVILNDFPVGASLEITLEGSLGAIKVYSTHPDAVNPLTKTVDRLTNATVISIPHDVKDSFGTVRDIRVSILSPIIQVKIVALDIGFKVPYYDTNTNRWSDGIPRKLLGRVNKTPTGLIDFTPVPLKKSIELLVNGYAPAGFWVPYMLPNPFFTTGIEVYPNHPIGDLKISPEVIQFVPARDGVPYVLVCKKP